EFELEDGRSGELVIDRSVAAEPEDFYDYDGHDSAWLQVIVDAIDEEGWHSATRGGPNDSDPNGETLPLVHAQPDGSFTIDAEVEKSAFHEDALDGDLTLAGRCPQPWES